MMKLIKKALKKACKSEYLDGVNIDNKSIDKIVALSSGDLRFAYNLLETCYYYKHKTITEDIDF